MNLLGGSTASFQVAGGPHGEITAVIDSFTLGSFAGKTSTWCYDFGLDISPPPVASIVAMGPFNSSGIFFDTRFIPAAAPAILIHFQAAVNNTCPDTCMANIHSEIVGQSIIPLDRKSANPKPTKPRLLNETGLFPFNLMLMTSRPPPPYSLRNSRPDLPGKFHCRPG